MNLDLDGVDISRLIALLQLQTAEYQRHARFLEGVKRMHDARVQALRDAELLSRVANRLTEVER